MSGKQDAPPAYGAPQAPPAAHYGDPNGSFPPQQGGYPPQGQFQGQYQQNPQMGYGGYPQDQGQYPPGQYPPQGYPPQQGGYYQQPQQGYNQNDRRSGGLMEGLMAGLCCCCCLDMLF